MNVFDYAIEMERDGESYYRSTAQQTAHKGIRDILIRLADAEVTHYRVLKKIKSGEETILADTSILKSVQNIFQEMTNSGDTSLLNIMELSLYRKAQEIEQKSIDFYRQLITETKDNNEVRILSTIAEEETKHYLILEKIVDFTSRPEQWLEDAEWYHRRITESAG